MLTNQLTNQPTNQLTNQPTNSPTTVALFVTCLVDMFRPQVGEATVTLLERLGIRVEFPEEQTCCGQPAYNAGWPAQAAALARRWVTVFEPYEAIVCPSGSCTAMVRHEYPRLLAGDPAWCGRAEALAGRTYELSEFLVDVLGLDGAAELARFDGKIAYHPSCHLLRVLGVDRQPRALLAAVQGAELAPLPDAEACCGFGGLFSVKQAQISGAMAARKARAVESSEADLVVACDAGCLMQIGGALSRRQSACRAVHLAELLAGMEAGPG